MIFRALTPTGDWTFGQGRSGYLTKEAAIQANIKNYCDARVAAGWSKSKIAVCTLGARGNTTATDVNTWLRANYTTFCGYLVDVGGDANIGTGSSGSATYWTDAVHYTDVGYQVLADLVMSTIPALAGSSAGWLLCNSSGPQNIGRGEY